MMEETMSSAWWLIAAPEIAMLGVICVVLIVDLFVEDENRGVTFWLSLVGLAATMWLTVETAADGLIVFDGAYVSDPLSLVLKVAAIGFVAIALCSPSTARPVPSLLWLRSGPEQRG